MREKLEKILCDKFNISEIDLDKNLTELAGDSFAKLEMLFEIEQEIGRKIPEQVIINMETIGDLIEAIK